VADPLLPMDTIDVVSFYTGLNKPVDLDYTQLTNLHNLMDEVMRSCLSNLQASRNMSLNDGSGICVRSI